MREKTSMKKDYEFIFEANDRVGDRIDQVRAEFADKVYYEFQPVFDVREGKHEIFGYEALLRLKEQDTSAFLKQMKKEDRAHELELLTFSEALREFRERRLEGKLFINSIAHVILSDEEYDHIFRHFFTPWDVVIESLEDEVFMNAAVLARKRDILRKRGFGIALDDYGTGINSVRALKLFKPDIVKIDQSYVRGFAENPAKSNALEIMIDEIRSQKGMVLAEGVETWSEYEALRFLGVDFMQGFYLGVPE